MIKILDCDENTPINLSVGIYFDYYGHGSLHKQYTRTLETGHNIEESQQ